MVKKDDWKIDKEMKLTFNNSSEKDQLCRSTWWKIILGEPHREKSFTCIQMDMFDASSGIKNDIH